MNIGKESEQIEFKSSLAEQRQGFDSIASILNKHQAGTIYFGVRDNGEVKGLQLGKDTLTFLSRDLEIYIKPSFLLSIKELHTSEGLTFIEISFNGNSTPYSSYGRYYLRFGDRDKVMDQQMLSNYFESKKQSYINWENSNSNCLIDDIEDSTLIEYIKKGNECGRISFKYDNKEKVLNRLGLLYDSKYLNNAGNVLFSSCQPISVKLATFATEGRTTIIDMNNFFGNIYQCIDESLSYVSKHIDWNISFEGNTRSNEVSEIPIAAVREIIINAFAHGSYESKATDFEVSIFKNRIVIYSPGHFPQPFTPEQFAYDGQEAIPLNNKICNILYNDQTIEKQSSGFERTFDLCKKNSVKYEYEDTGYGFRFTFYRKNYSLGSDKVKINKKDDNVYKEVKSNPRCTIKEISSKLNINEKATYRALSKLKITNRIDRIGSARNGYWKIIK